MVVTSLTRKSLFLTTVLTLVLLLSTGMTRAAGSELENRYLKISDNLRGSVATYEFGFKTPGLATMQTVVFELCRNSPDINDICVVPTGIDVSNVVLTGQTGDVGFSRSGLTNTNRIVLSRPPVASDGVQSSYTFSGARNPSLNTTTYVRMMVYQDGDISGEPVYSGGATFTIADRVDVRAVVPPYLLFCAGITVRGNDCSQVEGNYVDFGEFTSRQASQGSTQMLAASNAKDGYNIRVLGTTLMSGTNVIPALTSQDQSRPGISQFGMNLQANSSPRGGIGASGPGSGQASPGYDIPNRYRFNSGDIVATTTRPDVARKYTVSYIVNVERNQAPGVYVGTLTYIALGSY